ncbi:MAG: aspartate aminotransferase family protein [Planctomycetia bacterium]|nr:aspartate aminotransferase family protein [Planctomycetia bacterium]
MRAPYREILDRIRLAFPQPTSDRVHDSYVVHSIMRALDQVDALKSEVPILGKSGPIDFESVRTHWQALKPSTIEEVTAELVRFLDGMPIFGHPRSQANVVPPSSIASIIGVLLASLYNPNLTSDEFSERVAVAEVEACAIAAQLVGYNPNSAAGVFTFGGTATALYGVKIGLEKACPGAMADGTPPNVVLCGSDTSHYCRYTAAGWLGIGTKNLISVPSRPDNAIDLKELERSCRQALDQGKRLACLIATLGTTDAFGLDDLAGMAALRDQLVRDYDLPYTPHLHADAVIGWAWSVFKDYDIEENPLGFRRRTVRALAGVCRHIRHLHLADSIGIDFHKTGFAPYISSLILVRDQHDFALLRRHAEQMPYLYHHGDYHPGTFTLETSRAGTGVLAAWANLRLFGKEGMQATLGHLVEMAQLLREHLEGHQATAVLNRDNFGTVTLFRVYPPNVDTFAIKEHEFEDPAHRDSLRQHNAYNRRVYEYVHREASAGRGVMISLTDCYRHTAYGEPIVALKTYILSPFVDEQHIEVVVQKVLEAREQIDAG